MIRQLKGISQMTENRTPPLEEITRLVGYLNKYRPLKERDADEIETTRIVMAWVEAEMMFASAGRNT
jgi:hypothetical protein